MQSADFCGLYFFVFLDMSDDNKLQESVCKEREHDLYGDRNGV